MLVPSDTVFVGQQVDSLPPPGFLASSASACAGRLCWTLDTPEGVWAYPTAASSGAALSRQVSGRWMDLFIAHEVVFPLAPAASFVPPATVEYALPVTFSFFSREERYALRSDSIAITVLPLPLLLRHERGRREAESRSADRPTSTRVGEPVEASITINGIGNVALWPPPEPGLRWPAGFRFVSRPNGNAAGGGRRPHRRQQDLPFPRVPDSSGNFVLPRSATLLQCGRWSLRSATAAPRALAVAPGAEPRAARVLPRCCRREARSRRHPEPALRWQDGSRLLLAPPFVALFASRRWRRAPAATVVTPGPGLTPLGRLEREFLAVLSSHVSDPFARDGDGLAPALRAAGVDSAVADHVKRLRDRLRAAR